MVPLTRRLFMFFPILDRTCSRLVLVSFPFSRKRGQLNFNSLKFLLAFVWIVPVMCFGQEYRGTITGQVTDPSGNVIQNATVVAKSPEQTYNGKTDSRGGFYIPYVQPGTYSIQVDAPGFKSVV